VEAAPQEEPNRLMRKKKTPEELAAEAEQEELDDFTSKFWLSLSIPVPSLLSYWHLYTAKTFHRDGPSITPRLPLL